MISSWVCFRQSGFYYKVVGGQIVRGANTVIDEENHIAALQSCSIEPILKYWESRRDLFKPAVIDEAMITPGDHFNYSWALEIIAED